MPAARRDRKRDATRQTISDVATALFMRHGFDRVTIDQIAAAADVGRMTVFNHFPRKEDMFFDREADIQTTVFAAVRGRASGVSPVEAVRRLAHALVKEGDPLLPLQEETDRFVATVLDSEGLKARARELRDRFVAAFAPVLAEAAGRSAADADAHLAANLIAASWSAAFLEAQRVRIGSGERVAATALFLRLVDRGSAAASAALAGTGYG